MANIDQCFTDPYQRFARGGGTASSPTPPQITGSMFYTFQSGVVAFTTSGDQVNTAFSSGLRVKVYKFPNDAAIFNLGLSTSILNPNAAVAALWVARDQGTTVAFDGGSRVYMVHLTYQNSLPGTPAPASRLNLKGYPLERAIRVNSGDSLAVYASAANDATVTLACALTFDWILIGT